ncbi:hypothetical protein RFI_03624 [Reticulomyxa filosa]|uniref:Ankyrin repeat protein n=1 Tax=Reticulomyxa filosa TaxID=46433 RepID=X6P5W3_RETFI|nr:hypothetical protein RFI_03624 [Reticulomyxa filosa]|eukprot:ETO33479.1 hypothetical protein RFI_03624 [Reticulomyxa filosa]
MYMLLFYVGLLWSKASALKEGDLIDLIQFIQDNNVSWFYDTVAKDSKLINYKYSSPNLQDSKQTQMVPHEYTFLDIATIFGNLEIVQYLLHHRIGGNPLESMYYICFNQSSFTDPWFNIPVSSLSNKEEFEDRFYSKSVLAMYLHYEVDINDRSSHKENISLITECMLQGYWEVTEMLLQNGANVYNKDKNGFDMIDWLVKAPVDKFCCCCCYHLLWSRTVLGHNAVLSQIIKFGELLKAYKVPFDVNRLSMLTKADEFALKHLEQIYSDEQSYSESVKQTSEQRVQSNRELIRQHLCDQKKKVERQIKERYQQTLSDTPRFGGKQESIRQRVLKAKICFHTIVFCFRLANVFFANNKPTIGRITDSDRREKWEAMKDAENKRLKRLESIQNEEMRQRDELRKMAAIRRTNFDIIVEEGIRDGEDSGTSKEIQGDPEASHEQGMKTQNQSEQHEDL